MSEEIELSPIDPDTFSFFDVLEERTYPKDEITVWLDEKAVYDFNKLTRKIDSTEGDVSEEQATEWLAEVEKLRNKINDSKMLFKLTGVADDRVETARELAEEKFKGFKKQRKLASGALEKYLPDDQQLAYLKYFNAVVMAMHVEQIVRLRDGATQTAPSPDEIQAFLDKAPAAAKADLNDKVQNLRLLSSQYESSLDEGFFQNS